MIGVHMRDDDAITMPVGERAGEQRIPRVPAAIEGNAGIHDGRAAGDADLWSRMVDAAIAARPRIDLPGTEVPRGRRVLTTRDLVLRTGAAVAATSGMVRYAGTAKHDVVTRWPEVVATEDAASAGRVQAWVVGPGLGTDESAEQTLRFTLGTDLPVIVDADALTLLARAPQLVADRGARLICCGRIQSSLLLPCWPPRLNAAINPPPQLTLTRPGPAVSVSAVACRILARPRNSALKRLGG